MDFLWLLFAFSDVLGLFLLFTWDMGQFLVPVAIRVKANYCFSGVGDDVRPGSDTSLSSPAAPVY